MFKFFDPSSEYFAEYNAFCRVGLYRSTFLVPLLQVGEHIQIEADVNAVIKPLKTAKTTGEDDIRPEMLKTVNVYSESWLTRVCQVACRTG